MPYIGNTAGNRFVASQAATRLSGDGSETVFTLEHSVASDEDILVSVDGVIQEPSIAYAVSNGTTLTFTAAPSNGTNNIFVCYLFRTVATVDHPPTSSLQATDGTFSAGITATTGTFSGAVTAASLDADGGITVDNITIDGTEIDLSSGDLTIDVAGDIILDADGGDIILKDGGTEFGNIANSSSDLQFVSIISDKDIIFRGNDGGSFINALTLDMSDAGKASFSSGINASGELDVASSSSLSTISATATGSANLVLGTNFSGSASQGMSNQVGFINMRQSYPIVFGTAETERFKIFADGTISTGTATTTGGDQFKINNNTSAGFALNLNNVNATDGLLITAQSGTGTVKHHQINNSNGLVGQIVSSGSGTSYVTSSDYRMKENISYNFDATTRLKQLKPARFNFIADPDTTVDGFIAHEVTAVPEAIIGTKDAMQVETRYTVDDKETQGDNPTKKVGEVKTYSKTKIDPQGIDQAKLVPLLTKALQEALTRIETLETKVTALESK